MDHCFSQMAPGFDSADPPGSMCTGGAVPAGCGAPGGPGRNRKRQVHVNENSPVIKAFRGYQTELDSKHDRHERIVKLSRDITIESKRTIFLLQRCAGEDVEEKEKVLQEAQDRLKEIQRTKFLSVALELEGQDHYQFIRAYSPGLQEYVEAVSFYHYLRDGQLVTLSEVESDLVFPRPPASVVAKPVPGSDVDSTGTVVSSTSGISNVTAVNKAEKGEKAEESSRPSPHASEVSSTSDTTAAGDNHQNSGNEVTGENVFVTVPPMEFMLGIADLTGELMRTAIMSVSAGNLDYPIQICDFMRVIHDSFMSYGNTARELSRKMATLRQSLQKVEGACYTLKVRGSEIPKHMLADIFQDEAFVEDAEVYE
ncbi:translin-associated protein X-like isoform X2 [Babylonia areolata]|uniref:translin-associated protein X-like isoform X2 n=1 Tax=Babylonia areolata TaxID=304850 RepID=UPI003FD4E217